jgi:hypothetical protein
MGSWGTGPFENDGAGDWLNRFEDCDPRDRIAFMANLFSNVADDCSYIQADEGESVVAAAAIAALNLPGGPSMTMVARPVHLDDDEVQVHVSDELRQLALRAVDRVGAENSELTDLWEGDELYLATLAQIRRVLAEAPR